LIAFDFERHPSVVATNSVVRMVFYLIFLTSEGKTYSKATIMRYFKIAKQIAGITRRFRFHDQRHTFASILATKGPSTPSRCATSSATRARAPPNGMRDRAMKRLPLSRRRSPKCSVRISCGKANESGWEKL
jgi:integrase